MSSRPSNPNSGFLSTPSVRRATHAFVVLSALYANFYPRPPCGGRQMDKTRRRKEAEFLSTPSVRRATRGWGPAFNKPPISIHALRAEGDTKP